MDGLESREARQQALRERFCFECTCERCSDAEPQVDGFLGSLQPEAQQGATAELKTDLQRAVSRGASLFLEMVRCRA